MPLTPDFLEELLDSGIVLSCPNCIPLEFHYLGVEGWVQPWFQHSKPNVCLRMHKDINIYIRWLCRYPPPPWTCKCNYRCLAKRHSLAVRNFLRSEESLNLCWIHAIYHTMPKPCLSCVDLQEPQKSFHSLLTVLQAKISMVVSSRYFFVMGCSV